MRNFIFLLAFSLSLFVSSAEATPKNFATRPDVQAYINSLVQKYNFDPVWLSETFGQVVPNKKIIKLMTRPSEVKPWYFYRSLFITKTRVNNGIEFWRQNQSALKQAEQVYGVPASIIVAIIGIETSYGDIKGKFRIIDALSTLAFLYPARAKFFRDELTQFLLLARDYKWDPTSVRGSYAGAIGMPQFMPSNYRHYAVNFSGKKEVDLINDPADSIGSVANYFKERGWEQGEPIASPARGSLWCFHLYNERFKKGNLPIATLFQLNKIGISPDKTFPDSMKATLMKLNNGIDEEYWVGFKNFYVITRYNSSILYAMAVYQLSQLLEKGMG